MKKSKIQWTDFTWNPWHGCTKVSPGCKFCYMYRDKERYGQDPTSVLKSKSNFDTPMRHPDPLTIFTCSWSDWFIPEADQWRDEAWRVIKATPHHRYQILTKRPDRIAGRLPEGYPNRYEHVSIGVSIESSEYLYRLDWLDLIPANKRFVSFEPLLSAIDFDTEINTVKAKDFPFAWAIIGGESGNRSGKYRYRKCELDWIRGIQKHCEDRNIPVFIKQLGTHLAGELQLKDRHGGDINEFPDDIRVRTTQP